MNSDLVGWDIWESKERSKAMKNILDETPSHDLHGRLLYSTRFVASEDMMSKKILDIGCGFGWFEVHALQSGCESIAGLEISEDDLETARKYIVDPKASFKVGGATNLPFGNETFDIVVAWEVLEHIPKNTEDIMFQEVYRVLKPGSHFYLSTPNKSFFSNILDPAWWLIGHRHYSVEQLRTLAESIGFSVAEIRVAAGWWSILHTLNMYVAKWILRRKPIMNEYFLAKVDQEYVSSGFTNIFMKLKKK